MMEIGTYVQVAFTGKIVSSGPGPKPGTTVYLIEDTSGHKCWVMQYFMRESGLYPSPFIDPLDGWHPQRPDPEAEGLPHG